MRDLAQKWPVAPDWQTAVLERDGLTVRTVSGLYQLLVSGELEAWGRSNGTMVGGSGLGLVPERARYAVRLARDRILAVGEKPFPVTAGWHAGGYAVSVMDAALHVFEISGPATARILARATTLAPGDASASASVLFAGANAVVYRFGSADRVRIHVDRGLATFVWEWLEQSASL